MAVTSSFSELRFDVEWLPADDVASAELAATWARLAIRVGDASVTHVDVESGAVRRSIFVPLYPLAEWIAYNWWFLRSHVRPSYLPSDFWTYQMLRPRRRRRGNDWLAHHNLRGIGDGSCGRISRSSRMDERSTSRGTAIACNVTGPI